MTRKTRLARAHNTFRRHPISQHAQAGVNSQPAELEIAATQTKQRQVTNSNSQPFRSSLISFCGSRFLAPSPLTPPALLPHSAFLIASEVK
jgi:hypothetical protein